MHMTVQYLLKAKKLRVIHKSNHEETQYTDTVCICHCWQHQTRHIETNLYSLSALHMCVVAL